MKIKGTIEDLKIKQKLKKRMILKIVKIYLGHWCCCGQYGVSSFSDSSFSQFSSVQSLSRVQLFETP